MTLGLMACVSIAADARVAAAASAATMAADDTTPGAPAPPAAPTDTAPSSAPATTVAAPASADSTTTRGADAIRASITAERYAEAERMARTLVDSLEAGSPRDSLRLGEAMTLLVEALLRSGRFASPGAAELSARAVFVRERTLGPDHPEVASALHHRANLLRSSGAVEGLQSMYERVLAIRLGAFGPNHRDVARTWNDYGNLMQLIGAYASAESLYLESSRAYERIGESQRRNLGKVLNNLAVLQQLAGDYVRARQTQERSKALFEQTLGPDHPNVGLACVNLATLLILTGDLEQARVLLDRGLDIHQRALGPGHADVAWTLRALAVLNARVGRNALARRQLERAVAIHVQSLGADHTEVALDLMELARLAEESGRDSAVALYTRALAINEHALGPSHPRTALTLAGLARLRATEGDLESAYRLEQRVLAIREEALGEAHPDVAASHLALAQTEWALGFAPRALRSALRAEAISREHLRLTLRTLPERQALAVAEARLPGLDLALSIFLEDSTAGSAVEIADALMRSRAVVLDEMMQRGQAVAAVGDPAIAALERDLATARDRLARLMVRDPGDGPQGRYRALIDHARRAKDSAERALAEASLRFRASEQERRAGFEEVRTALPATTALLSFVEFQRWTRPHAAGARPRSTRMRAAEPAYAACVIRKDHAPILIGLGAAVTIDSLVARWAREIASGAAVPVWQLAQAEARYRQAGLRLRERVWTPVAGALAGSSGVFVVPDGALHLVHLGTLPAASGYMIEENATLHYLSAERHLISALDVRAAGAGLLVMGGPDFDGDQGARAARRSSAANAAHAGTRRGPCADLPAPAFEPLPLASAEARWIAQQWNERWSATSAVARSAAKPAVCLVGAAATEDAFKRLAPGRRVLHIATHGYFPPPPCAREPRVTAVAAWPGAASQHPGARAVFSVPGGLAFAGANRSDTVAAGAEDGILTPEEIAGIDLGTVEWTVLSACNTGLGDVRAGEGVFGLRRAFEIARCRSLIMSLWPVPDDAARDWMQSLYTGKFDRGLDTAAAVRGASLHLLGRQRDARASTHPFLWAGFIAAGDWR